MRQRLWQLLRDVHTGECGRKFLRAALVLHLPLADLTGQKTEGNFGSLKKNNSKQTNKCKEEMRHAKVSF